MASPYTNNKSALVRLNKYVADMGIASRREADLLIADGKILVNGKKGFIGQKVSKKDVVTLAGDTKERIYLAYYKGRGILTHGNEGETVAGRLKKDYGIENVYPVGRLDKVSEGLLILTSDGRITAPLLDPEGGHEKEYTVMVDKPVTGFFLQKLENGVRIEGYRTKRAKAVKHPENKLSFTITLTEGKKHQIRRMCAALGYQVQSLKRVRIANIELKSLKPNQYRKIEGSELKAFLTELRVTS